MNWSPTVELKGNFVTLEILNEKHIQPLKEAVIDGESWRLWFANVPSPQEMEAYVTAAILASKKDTVAFAVKQVSTNKIVGTTRLYNIDIPNKRTMLGYTWYAKAAQRTQVNTACKYLLLKHAFETHKAIAVEFRTHALNENSRRAIERLGAKQDGLLRNHQIMKDGSIRDSAVYSIINKEWLLVKNNLLGKLSKYY